MNWKRKQRRVLQRPRAKQPLAQGQTVVSEGGKTRHNTMNMVLAL